VAKSGGQQLLNMQYGHVNNFPAAQLPCTIDANVGKYFLKDHTKELGI